MITLYDIYAALLLVGGILGYARAKSAPSLAAGVVAAVLMVAAAWLLSVHHAHRGLALASVIALALGAFFFRRYQETRKPMPAVLVMVMSVVVLVASVLVFFGIIPV